jgi:tRNA threonylcarbamoyladenosine biosynthesis protein TsaB
MNGILAIDTATDACSVAVYQGGEVRERFEVAPRRHNQILFGMLAALLDNGDLRAQGIAAIAYGCGPGSFTGLRVAASAVQGLAYANQLPCLPVSTLLTQAQGALRSGLVAPGDRVLSTVDARIHELYWLLVTFDDSLAVTAAGPGGCAPDALQLPADDQVTTLKGIGSGLCYRDEFPSALQERLEIVAQDYLPSARDMIPLAAAALEMGITQQAHEVSPVYVREEISWKKIGEQGRR